MSIELNVKMAHVVLARQNYNYLIQLTDFIECCGHLARR